MEALLGGHGLLNPYSGAFGSRFSMKLMFSAWSIAMPPLNSGTTL
jgi:hypothetical protein